MPRAPEPQWNYQSVVRVWQLSSSQVFNNGQRCQSAKMSRVRSDLVVRFNAEFGGLGKYA